MSEAHWSLNIALLLGVATAAVYSLMSYVVNLIIKVTKKRKLSILDKMLLSNQSFVLIFIVNLFIMILRVQQYVIPAYTIQIVIFWALLAAIIIHSVMKS